MKDEIPFKAPASNTWATPIYNPGTRTSISSTTKLEDAMNKISSNVCVFYYTNANSRPGFVTATFLNSSLVVVPTHLFNDQDCVVGKATLPCKDGTFITRNMALEKSRAVHIPQKDVSIVSVIGGFGERPNIHVLLPETEPVGQMVVSWYHFEKDFQVRSLDKVPANCGVTTETTDLKGEHRTCAIRTIQMQLREPTFQGSCGSPVFNEDKGTSMIGFYIAGNGPDRIGVASCLTQGEFRAATAELERRRLYLPRNERGASVTAIGPYQMKVAPGSHYKNPVNFQTEPGYVEAYFEPTVTPRCTTIPAPYRKEAQEILDIGENYHAPNMNFERIVQPVIENAWKKIPPPPSEAMAAAVDDYCKVIPAAVARMKGIKCADGTPAMLYRPLTSEEAINGIPGNPLFKRMDASTSAGCPYNTPKKNVLLGDPEHGYYLGEDDKIALFEALTNLQDGRTSGSVYNCTIKSEARPPEKTLARAFQSISLISNIITKQYTEPLMQVITCNGKAFETAIGSNALGRDWSVLTSDLFEADRLVSDEDYKNFDQTLCRELRQGGAMVFVEIAKALEWPEIEIKMLKSVCSEFLDPLINMRGAVIVGENLQPSGTNVTAHLNSIVNSLASRISFYMHHSADHNFRDYVRMITLGDDLLKSILADWADQWTPEMMKEDVATFGMVLTPGSKDDKALAWKKTDCHPQFLKRETIYNEDVGMPIGVLARKSKMRPFEMVTDLKIPPIAHQMQAADTCNRETLYLGRREYEMQREALQKYLAAIGGIPTYATLALSYDEMVAEVRFANGIVENLPKPDGMPVRAAPEFYKYDFVQESGEVSWDLGTSMTTPEAIVRVHSGEVNVSLRPILKVFSNSRTFSVLSGNPNVLTQGIYDAPNPSIPTVWNLLHLSYYGVRGGVVLFHFIDGDGIIKVWKSFAYRGPSSGEEMQIGFNITDSRINPVLITSIPGQSRDRFRVTTGSQPGLVPQGLTFDVDVVSNCNLIVARSAGEDHSLLGFRGVPLLHNTTRRRMIQEAGEVGITEFSEGDATAESETVAVLTDPSITRLDENHASEGLGRIIELPSLSFNLGALDVYRFYPMQYWVSNPFIQRKLAGENLLRLTLNVRFESSESAQYSGLIMASYCALRQDLDFQNVSNPTAGTNDVMLSLRGNLPHVVHKVGAGGCSDLVIPFFYYHSHLSVPHMMAAYLAAAPMEYDPVVVIQPISSPQTTLEASAPVVLKVMLFATDIEVGGYTAYYQEAGEVPSAQAAHAAHLLGGIAQALAGAPTLALPFELAARAAEGSSGLLRYFGHSRPVHSGGSQNIPTMVSPLTTFNTDICGGTVAFDVNQQLSIDGAIGGMGSRSETEIADIISKPFLIGTFSCDTTTVLGPIFSLNVGPQLMNVDTQFLCLGGGGLLSTLFESWYGSMEYEIELISPMNTGGIIQLTYEPSGPMLSSSTLTNTRNIRVNIRDKEKIKIKVGWHTNRGVLATLSNTPLAGPTDVTVATFDETCHNGTLTCALIDPISSPGTTNVRLDLVLWGACDRTMMFFGLNPAGLGGYEIYNIANVTNVLTTPVTPTTSPINTVLPMGTQSVSLNTVPGVPIPSFPGREACVPTPGPTPAPVHMPIPTPTAKPATRLPTRSPIVRTTAAPVPAPRSLEPTSTDFFGDQPTVAPTWSTLLPTWTKREPTDVPSVPTLEPTPGDTTAQPTFICEPERQDIYPWLAKATVDGAPVNIPFPGSDFVNLPAGSDGLVAIPVYGSTNRVVVRVEFSNGGGFVANASLVVTAGNVGYFTYHPVPIPTEALAGACWISNVSTFVPAGNRFVKIMGTAMSDAGGSKLALVSATNSLGDVFECGQLPRNQSIYAPQWSCSSNSPFAIIGEGALRTCHLTTCTTGTGVWSDCLNAVNCPNVPDVVAGWGVLTDARSIQTPNANTGTHIYCMYALKH